MSVFCLLYTLEHIIYVVFAYCSISLLRLQLNTECQFNLSCVSVMFTPEYTVPTVIHVLACQCQLLYLYWHVSASCHTCTGMSVPAVMLVLACQCQLLYLYCHVSVNCHTCTDMSVPAVLLTCLSVVSALKDIVNSIFYLYYIMLVL